MHHCCWLLFVLWSLATAFGTHQGIASRGKKLRQNTNANANANPFLRLVPTQLHGSDQQLQHQDATSVKFPKTEEETKFIEKALLNNVMFTSLPQSTLASLIDAFESVTCSQGQVIVQQGDSCDNDYVYLIYTGECTVVVDGNVVPEPYGTLKPKSIFGELGVLYNQTRAATITAKSADGVQLYRVQGDTLKQVLNELVRDYFLSDVDELAQIDLAINQVSGTKTMYGGSIIRQYHPNRSWLWRQWTGTVLQHNWKTMLRVMACTALFVYLVRHLTDPTWPIGLAPDPSHPLIKRLTIIKKVWSYQTGLTTFILTFFVNQAYGFWQEVVGIARRIQGRLNDFHLLLAVNCKRNTDGTYTQQSERLMDSVGQSSRLLHALFWASCARRFSCLSTPKGMARMASRGLMSSAQLQVLCNLDLPDTQRYHACLEWMMVRANQGLADGTLIGGETVRKQLLDQMCQLRGTYGSISDKMACRMPLAYTHFVQILVDTFVWMAPLALYAELGAFSIVCVGVMTMFYTGLLDLAKIFLDPLDNEDFTKNSIDMDLGVLIRESNAGSTRWKNAGAQLPFTVK